MVAVITITKIDSSSLYHLKLSIEFQIPDVYIIWWLACVTSIDLNIAGCISGATNVMYESYTNNSNHYYEFEEGPVIYIYQLIHCKQILKVELSTKTLLYFGDFKRWPPAIILLLAQKLSCQTLQLIQIKTG